MGIKAAPELEDRELPGWLDFLIAVWIIICAVVFISRVLVDVGMTLPILQNVIVGGTYFYVISIAGCVIGGSLILLRRLHRS